MKHKPTKQHLLKQGSLRFRLIAMMVLFYAFLVWGQPQAISHDPLKDLYFWVAKISIGLSGLLWVIELLTIGYRLLTLEPKKS